MPSTIETQPQMRKREARVLPLENGDHLSAKEFLRRYEAMPEIKKAELIEGVVYMGSAVSLAHGKRDGLIQGWASLYASHTPLVKYAPNTTVILDPENTHQPDAWLRLLPEYGGRTQVNEKGLLAGAPELTIEIAASSASIDLGPKLRASQRNGILEYLVWIVAEEEFKWFILEEERYIEQQPDAKGLLSSRTFPGLVLAVDKLLALDGAAVLAALEKGIRSPAHATFLQRAKSERRSRK